MKYLERGSTELEKSVQQQKKYYDKRRRDVHFALCDLVLLSTTKLRVKSVPTKLQHKFVGPFTVLEKIGSLAYRLQLPDT